MLFLELAEKTAIMNAASRMVNTVLRRQLMKTLLVLYLAVMKKKRL